MYVLVKCVATIYENYVNNTNRGTAIAVYTDDTLATPILTASFGAYNYTQGSGTGEYADDAAYLTAMGWALCSNQTANAGERLFYVAETAANKTISLKGSVVFNSNTKNIAYVADGNDADSLPDELRLNVDAGLTYKIVIDFEAVAVQARNVIASPSATITTDNVTAIVNAMEHQQVATAA